MSVFRKAMVYLGLVDDDEYYGDDAAYYEDDAYAGRTFADRGLEITCHTHRELPQSEACSQRA